MKLLKSLLILVLLSLNTLSYGQILSVTETYKGDKRTVAIDDKQIVEINSTLEVQVSKENLLRAIQSQFPNLTKTVQLESKLVQLQNALRNQSVVISILEKQLSTTEEQQTFFEIMENFIEDIKQDPYLLSRYNELFQEFYTTQAFVEGDLPEPYIFSNLNKDLFSIEEELKSIETEKYTVSVLAFKKDKSGGNQVHVQNYDTYSSHDFFNVKRWVTSLSEEQTEQLETLAELAKENKAKELELFKTLKTKLLNEFKSIDCFIALKKKSVGVIKNIELTDTIPVEIKTKIAAIQSSINQFETLYTLLKTDVSQWNITVPFEINNQVQSIIDQLKTIDTNFSDLKTLINQTTLVSKFEPLTNEFNTCYTNVQEDLKKLRHGIVLLFGIQSNYIANKSIGEEVLSFSVDNLPERGFVNLKGTGKRENGDELLIEIVLRLPPAEKDKTEQTYTLEQREFTMHLLGARSEIAVGLIFANSFNKNDLNLQSERDFFYAPSASLLLKFGSSKSYFYNEFVDFGVGINFASPDFNTDGSPEFGLGIITTAFKDILSVGINYNLSIDNFYWFFGINLPFNLPGLPVNTINN